MKKENLKVIIVGGGPCGLLTGILLSRIGAQVTIVEKNLWPIDKVCGEGIMPVGVELLKKYDLLKFIDKDWIQSFEGIKYIDSNGITASGKFNNDPGLIIRRTALSQGLYKAASLEKNLTLLAHSELINFHEDQDYISVTLQKNKTKELFSLKNFTYLIGADGLRSKVRSLNHMEGKIRTKQLSRMGARTHYKIPPWDKKVQVWWQDGIECYVAPTSKDCVEFNFGWDHDILRPQTSGKTKGLESGLFSYFPELENKIKQAKQLSPMQSWGPLPHRAKTHLKKRVALIGDAGLFHDQITGEGLSLSFVQAELVSRTIKDWNTEEGQLFFNKTLTEIGNKYIEITNLAMFFTRHFFFRKLMILFLRRSPKLFAHLLHVNMGEHSLYKIPFKLIFQAIFFPHREDKDLNLGNSARGK